MPRHYKALGFLLVAILGIYGCAKGPGGSAPTGSGSNTNNSQKLEADYRAAVAARDHFRQKLAAAEEQQAQAQRELEQARAEAAAERETLKGEVKARTGERDAIQIQYETFRKHLKELIGTADNAVGALNLPAPKPAADRSVQW
jgi:septal ring factor EnvC (AmiA/AmiB activator)